jgi:type I restriction enzyme S subunit
LARLGDYIREECNPLGSLGPRHLRLIGVSNEHGLHVSSRGTSDDLSRYQRVEKNWFAYNPMRVNVGSIGLADDDAKTGFTSPDYTVFSCREGLEPHYLLHFLKSDYGLDAIARKCSGTVRKRLYYSGLAEINLPIPSLDEQRELVRKIRSIAETIRFIREENSDRHELPQLKEAILQAAIQGKLTAGWRRTHRDVEPVSQLLLRIQSEKSRLSRAKRFQSDKPLPKVTAAEIPFDIPEGWEWCRLGSITRFFDYRGRTPRKVDSGVNLITAKNVKFGHFSETPRDYVSETTYSRHMIRGFPENGDILFTTEAPLGNACQLDMHVRYALGQRLITIQPFLSNKRFFLNVILSPAFQMQLLEKASGITAKGIKSGRLVNLLIPLPPLAEQDAIVERVDALMTTYRELESEIEHSRVDAAHLLQVILKEAFALPLETGTSAAAVEHDERVYA